MRYFFVKRVKRNGDFYKFAGNGPIVNGMKAISNQFVESIK